MIISKEGLSLIKKWEGIMDGDPSTVNLDPYLCPAGYWTIGWGHVVRDSRGQMLRGKSTASIAKAVYPRGITMDEAEALLRNDVRSFEFEVTRALRSSSDNTPVQQFSAMVALAFNIGSGSFLTSTVLRRHLAGQRCSQVPAASAASRFAYGSEPTANAADAFLLWNKMTDPSTGVKSTARGLVNRRLDERALYLSAC